MNRVPFNQNELDSNEFYPPTRVNVPPAKKLNTPITPKENFKMLYRGEVPMWIPMSTDKLTLTPRIDPDNMARAFAFEANSITPEEMVGGKDKFGIEWVYVPVAQGSMVKPGNPTLLDVNDWKEVINFPNIEEWDWEGTKKSHEEYCKTDRLIQVTMLTGFFERLISFMDFENAALAMIDDDQKEALHELYSAIADLYIKMIDKFIECYNMDLFQLHDDWGSQRAPFFSLNTAMEMIVPHMKRIVDHCHSKGIFIELHSCGKNEMLVPAYIEAGFDSWTGQPMNDKNLLYDLYGDKIMLGIEPDITKTATAPFDVDASVESAKAFVEKYAADFDKKPVTSSFMAGPPEYNFALYEASRKAFCG